MARAWLDGWRAFASLRAVRRQQLLANDDARLTRMGPETVAAAEALCRQFAALPAAAL